MKRMLSFILMILVLCSVCIPVGAKVVTVYGDWTLEKYNNDTEWMIDSCSSTDADIVVADTYAGSRVTYLADHAFVNNATMQTLIVPFGIVGFGRYSFSNCIALQHVTLPSSITVFSEGVFSDTPLLEDINLEDTRISSVQSYSFKNSGIKSIALPDSCSTIKENAFLNCTELEAFYLPSNVSIIENDAFKGCDDLVIYAEYDSYAIKYAKAKGIPYVVTDGQEVTFMLGDADGDNAVTIVDVTQIQRVLAELVPDDDGMIALRGLVTEDLGHNEMTIMDATRIQRWLAEYAVDAPIGEVVTKLIPSSN